MLTSQTLSYANSFEFVQNMEDVSRGQDFQQTDPKFETLIYS